MARAVKDLYTHQGGREEKANSDWEKRCWNPVVAMVTILAR